MTVQEIEEATKADVTLQAVSKAIEKGNRYEATKESSIDAGEFSAWQKVKDELTEAVNPKVILSGTRIAVPKKLQECFKPCPQRTPRSCESKITLMQKSVVSWD